MSLGFGVELKRVHLVADSWTFRNLARFQLKLSIWFHFATHNEYVLVIKGTQGCDMTVLETYFYVASTAIQL